MCDNFANALPPSEGDHARHLPARCTVKVLVKEVAPFRELQFVDLQGKLEQHVAFMDCPPDLFRIHVPVVQASVEAAEACTWWAPGDDVRLLLLD